MHSGHTYFNAKMKKRKVRTRNVPQLVTSSRTIWCWINHPVKMDVPSPPSGSSICADRKSHASKNDSPQIFSSSQYPNESDESTPVITQPMVTKTAAFFLVVCISSCTNAVTTS